MGRSLKRIDLETPFGKLENKERQENYMQILKERMQNV